MLCIWRLFQGSGYRRLTEMPRKELGGGIVIPFPGSFAAFLVSTHFSV